MKKCAGVHRVNDDEWYTPKTTSDKLARWLYGRRKTATAKGGERSEGLPCGKSIRG